MGERLKARTLAKHYINICNTAFVAHRDEFPYRQIIALMNRLYSGDTITMRIVDDRGEPESCVTTRFIDGQFTPVQEGSLDADAEFTLERPFLEDVVEHADDYIRHPRKLDFSWMTARLGPLGSE